MGKKGKKESGNLGKSLIRDRFGSGKIKRNSKEPSMLHTAELNDGYDWGRLNLKSITEESSFQEFLSTAELANTEFAGEKLNIKFVNASSAGLLTREEREKILKAQEENKGLVKIPRRPKWDNSVSASELQTREKETFLEWRRGLSLLQETEGLILTPYEKNLEFWRQLWRVVERSDVVVQIVDARNPLLFRCEDLERYVREVSPDKLNMILLNKADFLTEEQREAWAKYFADINVTAAFYSATLAAEKQTIQEEDEDNATDSSEEEKQTIQEEDEDNATDSSEEESEDDIDESRSKLAQKSESKSETAVDDDDRNDTRDISDTEADKRVESQLCAIENLEVSPTDEKKIVNSSKLLDRDELVKLFKTIYTGDKTYTDGVTTIGLVGYPNVGKSSTINALMMSKRVSVSATPGKTKHFQTLYLDKDLLLCDCPGLVMPSFVCTKEEMILNGILPIDQMRNHVPAVTLLATLIPRHVLEDLYGFMLPVSSEENPDRSPTAEEVLNAHAYNRGFMTQNGQPDNPRSARYVLKDFVNGKLLYCVAPPTVEQKSFHVFPPRRRNFANKHIPPRETRVNQGYRVTADTVDRKFFQDVHVKGNRGLAPQHSKKLVGSTTLTEVIDQANGNKKPWKMMNKHANKNKREKTRRLYAYLDQH